MAEKQYIRSLSTKILIAFGTMSVGLTLFSLFATLITTDGERSKYATLLMGVSKLGGFRFGGCRHIENLLS